MDQHTPIPRPADEAERLEALRRFAQLDSPPDADFDFLTEMAAAVCGAPCSFVSLVDAERVWYKSAFGKDVAETPRDDDYCSWAILEQERLHISDLRKDPRTANMELTTGPAQYRMYSGANLVTSDGHHIGTLCVLDHSARTLRGEQLALLDRLARQVMNLIELRAKSRALELAYARMEKLATFDELTGLLNRRALLARLHDEVQRCRRQGSELSVVMIDLDHFKQVNDTHGHQTGDAVLRGVGALLRSRIRVTDSAGRYGGEELCLLLPGTGVAAAALLADKLRRAVADTVFRCGEAQVQVTASFGIAAYHAEHAPVAERLIEAADLTLFRAKHGGRNRVELHAPMA
ncbi:MAG: sensor domain-containing diguanylate cyclase [Pseudomonadota bacterium]